MHDKFLREKLRNSTQVDLSVFLQFNRIKSILGGIPDTLVDMKDETTDKPQAKTQKKSSKKKEAVAVAGSKSAEVMEMMKLAV